MNEEWKIVLFAMTWPWVVVLIIYGASRMARRVRFAYRHSFRSVGMGNIRTFIKMMRVGKRIGL